MPSWTWAACGAGARARHKPAGGRRVCVGAGLYRPPTHEVAAHVQGARMVSAAASTVAQSLRRAEVYLDAGSAVASRRHDFADFACGGVLARGGQGERGGGCFSSLPTSGGITTANRFRRRSSWLSGWAWIRVMSRSTSPTWKRPVTSGVSPATAPMAGRQATLTTCRVS